jgi:hypothetical protein
VLRFCDAFCNDFGASMNSHPRGVLVPNDYLPRFWASLLCKGRPVPQPPRYDIKGCEVSRWVEPAPECNELVLVLKDLNFQGKTINVGEPQGVTVLLFLCSG